MRSFGHSYAHIRLFRRTTTEQTAIKPLLWHYLRPNYPKKTPTWGPYELEHSPLSHRTTFKHIRHNQTGIKTSCTGEKIALKETSYHIDLNNFL